MARTVTIQLEEPRLDIDETRIEAVVIREPKAHEFFTHGMPWTTVQRPDGSVIVIENTETIRTYLTLLVEQPKSPNVINSLGLRDATAVKDAIIGFFVDAQKASSQRSATSSSSAPASSTPRPVVN